MKYKRRRELQEIIAESIMDTWIRRGSGVPRHVLANAILLRLSAQFDFHKKRRRTR
jgi:hypothetical protein